MVDVEKISDSASLFSWLIYLPEDERRNAALTIACRAALRVVPRYIRISDRAFLVDPCREHTLAWFRCILSSAAMMVMPSNQVKRACAAATSATQNKANFAASNAALAFSSAAAATSTSTALSSAVSNITFWNSVNADIHEWHKNPYPARLMSKPLWPQFVPVGISKDWVRLRGKLLEGDPNYQWWIDWVETFRGESSQSWESLIDIALWPDEDWEKGYKHINKRLMDEYGVLFEPTFTGPKTTRQTSSPKVEATGTSIAVTKTADATHAAFEGIAKNVVITKSHAEEVGGHIRLAISGYCTRTKQNCLPEELRFIESIGGIFNQIATQLDHNASLEARCAYLQGQVDMLMPLYGKLAETFEIKGTSKSGGFWSGFTEESGKIAGKLFVWTVAAPVIGAGFYFGQAYAPNVFEKVAKGYVEFVKIRGG